MARPLNAKQPYVIPPDLLDDIASRFLLDAPDSDLENTISLAFLTELAYWFYLDQYVEEDDNLNNVKFDHFAQQLLGRVGMKPKNGTIEDMLFEFREFKHRVPTYGGLILNDDLTQVLLAQGFWHRASWGFPKGKINVDEEAHKCAIREVLEETGFDISSIIDPNIYLETTIGEQFVRLYIIPGVPTHTQFCPRTKGEIKQLKWFPIHQLPAHKNDRNFRKLYGSANMFYMVMPFVKPLREWLANRVKTQITGGVGAASAAGREGRRRHRSNTTSESQHQTEEMANYERQKARDCSPRKKDKGKSKKTLFTDQNEEHQKFTFKNRSSKGRSSSNNGNGNSATSGRQELQYINNGGGGGMLANGGGSVSVPKGMKSCQGQNNSGFMRSYSWQNFRVNKKAVNDALDEVWRGLAL
ncbi:decapping mRNA 2 [Oratosquilla oratoria]|uniref:decapping mRNA 2 n=1 Tax=Oratosquilla oratoria TaxID=337810 RepID=UPI003F7666DC